MNIYKERVDKVWETMQKFKEDGTYDGLTHNETLAANRRWLKRSRRGDYLIKIGSNNTKNYTGDHQQYVAYTFTDGWFNLSSRKDAQWFSGEEAQYLIRNFFVKGFTIVRK